MKTLRFAIFGTGIMADIYARLLRQRTDCELCAIVGNTREKTDEFVSRFTVPAFYESDYVGMFKALPDIDAVIVATPEWIREKPIQAAIDNNVHILLEKPFADSWTEARKLYGMLHNYPKVVSLCHVLRYSPRFVAMQNAVERGEIGSVRHIYARRNSNNLRVNRVLGKTNLAYWLTPHDVDMIQSVITSPISKVYVSTRAQATSSDDYIIATLQFGGGETAVVEISWCGPPVSGASREAVFEVRGTAGNIEVADYDMNVTIFKSDRKVIVEDTYEDFLLHGNHRGYFFELINSFIERTRKPSDNSNDLSVALETCRICEMISQSIEKESVITSHSIA